MTVARLAARCCELLGAVEGPVIVQPPGGPLAVAIGQRVEVAEASHAAGTPAAAVCTFLGLRAEAPMRQARLGALATRLPREARVVVVDYNQPRVWWRRVLGAALLALRGFPPARARYPVARELRDHGFAIERLCLAAGERVQLVVGRRA